MTRLEPVVPAQALAAIRAPFLERGAAPVDPPIMQPLSLMLDLAGETMRARLFVVQADGIEEGCLRPDFTIPVARAHIASSAPSGRYVYEGKAFRVTPPGSDRPEEFLQIGLEIYEDGDVAVLDAEAASLAWRAALAGGRTDLTLQMGDVGLFTAFLDALGLAAPLRARLGRAFRRPKGMKAELERAQAPQAEAGVGDRLSGLLIGLPEAEAAAVLEDLWALAGIQPVGGRAPAEIVHRLAQRAQDAGGPSLSSAEADLIGRFLAVSDRPSAALDQVAALAKEAKADLTTPLDAWARRLKRLTDDGPPQDQMRLSTAFGRAFAYYDGVLFEVRSAALDEERPVAAGGRYDGLLRRLGGEQGAGAVGCIVRPWRAFAGGEA